MEYSHELLNEGLSCSPCGNLKEIPFPMHYLFVAAINESNECFTVQIPPLKLGSEGG